LLWKRGRKVFDNERKWAERERGDNVQIQSRREFLILIGIGKP